MNTIVCLAGLVLATVLSSAQDFALEWFTLDSGGGISSDGNFEIKGSITHLEAQAITGGPFRFTGEFLNLIPGRAPTVVIFDNSTGSENGGFGATATTWLASKFCLGAQSYGLDSISLLASNGRFDGQPLGPSQLQLQIYSDNPASGKPSAPAPVIMKLAGLTNPVSVKHQWIKWTNASPFRLEANTCYWAVFSVESGFSAGLIASFTRPTGDASTFGSSRSLDSGSTWSAPEGAINQKMVIEGFAAGSTTPHPEVTITALARVGTSLKVTFTSVTGRHYVIQRNPGLLASGWTDLPAGPVLAVGNMTEVTQTEAFQLSQQFYRVRIVP